MFAGPACNCQHIIFGYIKIFFCTKVMNNLSVQYGGVHKGASRNLYKSRLAPLLCKSLYTLPEKSSLLLVNDPVNQSGKKMLQRTEIKRI